MQQRFNVSASARTRLAGALTLATLAALTACGGGGGSSGGTPTASVTAMAVSSPKYASTATITINGTGLDSTLAVTSTICANMALQAGSTATTATYTCTVSGGLTGTVIAKSNGTQVGHATLTVPAPQVTMMVNNGLAAVGNIVITLAPDKAPKTVDNFLHYVNTGFYDQTIFHRIVAGFIMQGGGYAPQITNVSTATIKAPTFPAIAVEATGLSNVSGTISMANANSPATVDSITTKAQFFFNLADNSASLDHLYPVFGTITGGATVVNAVIAAPANCVGNPLAGTTDCLPVPNAVITSATQTQ